MYLSISVGGTFESTDQEKSWSPLNKGIAADFLPDPTAEYGHDPHCMVVHPQKPDRLYQLYFGTTCGETWASKDEGETWSCIVRHLPEIYSLSVSAV